MTDTLPSYSKQLLTLDPIIEEKEHAGSIIEEKLLDKTS
jgi:hypothetical protein